MDVVSTPQHIHWNPYSPALFEEAAAQDKLLLLDSGASWCHWCHVMDQTTYEDEELIALVAEKFIAVRIDRDRHGELDAYLQRTAALSGGQAGGWPLTVILTPQGHVLFKATYLPPRADERLGAGMGLIDILRRLDEYWRSHRQEISQAGAQLAEHLQRQYQDFFANAQALGPLPIRRAVRGIKADRDTRHGGFGSAPKFFHASALELLLSEGWRGEKEALEAAVHALTAMAQGGVYDLVGGGFHRYSVDNGWHVPHFEKMAGDNAALLGLYAQAFALTGDERFERVARETLAFIGMTLCDAEGNGFYASQDADSAAGDDGDYFTWTLDEMRAALGEEAQIAIKFFDANQAGDMPDRPGRNVLHRPRSVEEYARTRGLEVDQLRQILTTARLKLFQARRARPSPSVDTTIFADINGMMIDAHLTAGEKLNDGRAIHLALATLDSVTAKLRDDRGVFAHYRDEGQLQGIGLLADQAWMARALLHAYATSLGPQYLQGARTLADYILANLVHADGAFVAAPADGEFAPPIQPPNGSDASLAAWPLQPFVSWEDSPVRSAGSVAAEMLVDLAYLTGEAKYRQAAGRALESVAGAIEEPTAFSLAGCALAIDHYLRGPRTIVIAGDQPAASCPLHTKATLDCGACTTAGRDDQKVTEQLSIVAHQSYLSGGIVMVLHRDNEVHRQVQQRLGLPEGPKPSAYVCRPGACLAPATTVQLLQERLKELARLEREQP